MDKEYTGQVGPGTDENQASQTANSFASLLRTGTAVGSKHFMILRAKKNVFPAVGHSYR